MWDFRLPFVGIGAAGGAGIDGRQGLDTNGKASGMNVRPATASGHRTRGQQVPTLRLLFRTSMQLQTRQRIRLAVYRNRVFFQAAFGSGFQLPLCPIGKVIPFEVLQPEFVV